MVRFSSWMLVVAVALMMAGCSNSSAPSTDSGSGDGSVEVEIPDTTSEADDIETALAALSEEDRTLAEAQQVCPVGGGALGSMGTPVKVDLDGTPVFICCEGCEETLKADPQKYLAKLSGEESAGESAAEGEAGDVDPATEGDAEAES